MKGRSELSEKTMISKFLSADFEAGDPQLRLKSGAEMKTGKQVSLDRFCRMTEKRQGLRKMGHRVHTVGSSPQWTQSSRCFYTWYYLHFFYIYNVELPFVLYILLVNPSKSLDADTVWAYGNPPNVCLKCKRSPRFSSPQNMWLLYTNTFYCTYITGWNNICAMKYRTSEQKANVSNCIKIAVCEEIQ